MDKRREEKRTTANTIEGHDSSLAQTFEYVSSSVTLVTSNALLQVGSTPTFAFYSIVLVLPLCHFFHDVHR